MGYQLERNKKVNPRTARKAYSEDGVAYVVVAGAPTHYISGFGLVGPGDTVTLAAGVEPGKFLRAVNPADVVKADGDPEVAAELADKAAKANASDQAKADAKK